jgi:hypothetical protein
MLSEVWENVKEWTPTLPSELPFWELKSWWTPKFSKNNCRDQNQLDWRVPYITRKLLELTYLKWARMSHLSTSNTSYGQKKGQESNCQIWLSITKSWETPRFPWMQMACHILLKSFQWGLQLCFRPHFNCRFANKIMRPQNCENYNFENFKTPTWESWDKMPFEC